MSFGNDSHCLLSLSRARRLAFRLQREIDPALFERYGPDPTSDWHCEGRDLVLVAGVGSSKTDCAGRQFLDPVPTSSFDSAVLGDKRENTRPRTIDHFDSCADERAPSRRADNLSPYGRPTAVPHRPGRTWTRRPIVVAGECRQNRECNEQRSLHDLSFRPRRPESANGRSSTATRRLHRGPLCRATNIRGCAGRRRSARRVISSATIISSCPRSRRTPPA